MSQVEIKKWEATLKAKAKQAKASGIPEDEMFMTYRRRVKSFKTAIKAMCVICMGSVKTTDCPCIECPLWLFRKGKNPFDKRVGNGGNAKALVAARKARKEKLAKKGKK